jgi:transmembrane sensor
VKAEKFFELLSRKLAGEATIQELDELEAMLQNNTELQQLSNFVNPIKLHEQTDTSKAEMAYAAHSVQMQFSGRFNNIETATSNNDVQTENPSKKSLVKYITRFTVAAACIGLAIIYYPLSNKPQKASPTSNEVVTRKGSNSKITLSDGTTVWLNADSKLAYKGFEGTNREVVLDGEAYFDVAKDSAHPFIIHAGSVNIKVLGTAFNVKAYPDDNTVETSLIHGLVELTTNDDKERKILLRPNEKVTIQKNKIPTVSVNTAAEKIVNTLPENVYTISRIVPDAVDSSIHEIAWIKSRLVFTAETFETLAKRMERWYNYTILFTDNNLKTLVFTGAFEQQPIQEALENLRFSCNNKFKFIIQKNTITIQPN